MASIVPDVLRPCQFIYLAEGAANIVFSMRPISPSRSLRPSALEEYSDSTPPPSVISDDEEDTSVQAIVGRDSKLLRLRKDVPTTIKVSVAQELWETLLKPFFEPNEIVQQQLIKVPEYIIESLNHDIGQMDIEDAIKNRRPAKRVGIFLAKDEHGLLITDMTPCIGFAAVFEFKPKWLAQSPSAPADAVRCRQCAIHARKHQEGYCPLDLVSSNIYDAVYVASKLVRSDSGHRDRVADWIINTRLLKKLRDVQELCDNQGPLNADPTDEGFRVAMTLRDCTMFLKFPDNEEGPVVARIGDLDVKSPAKGAQWKETEEQLVREGWYAGTEEEEVKREITCLIGRKFDTKDRI